jgi:hypothetical protein
MDGGGGEQHEAGLVDAAPQLRGDASAQQRRDLDRQQQVEAHDPPRDRERTPVGRERYKQVRQGELDVVVEGERCDVHYGEDDGEPAEEPVEIGQPRRFRAASERAGGQRQAPEHRRGAEPPGDESGGPSDVPDESRIGGNGHHALLYTVAAARVGLTPTGRRWSVVVILTFVLLVVLVLVLIVR